VKLSSHSHGYVTFLSKSSTNPCDLEHFHQSNLPNFVSLPLNHLMKCVLFISFLAAFHLKIKVDLWHCWLSTGCRLLSNLGVWVFYALISALLCIFFQDIQTTWCSRSSAGALMSWHHIWPRSMAATTLSQMRRGWVFGRFSLILVCGWTVTAVTVFPTFVGFPTLRP